MRAGDGAAPHAVDVLEFFRPARAGRLDAHESAMRFDARVGPVLQPAQRIRAAGEIREGGFHERTFPESFVEPLSESAKGEGIPEDQDTDGILRRDGLHLARGAWLPRKHWRRQQGECDQPGKDFVFRNSHWGRATLDTAIAFQRIGSRVKEIKERRFTNRRPKQTAVWRPPLLEVTLRSAPWPSLRSLP